MKASADAATARPGATLDSREFRIGEWTLDPERHELRAGGESVRLEPKAIEVLRQLALRPGRVISREELLSLVWPGVVVGDDALTQAIIKLRKALGDEAQSPRYIETIPKGGYRLIARVGPPATQGEAPASIAPLPRRKRAWVAAGALVAIVLAAIWAVPELTRRSGMPWPIGADTQERTPAGTFPLVAVLPLANLSGDPAREYLSDGITEDLIDALGRFSGLRVMSRNTVGAYKGKEPSTQTIRNDLKARYVVRGSVREAGGTIRVAVELSETDKGVQLWSERYDGQGAQLFEIQDRIVRNIVGALAVRLTDIEQQRAVARATESAEAYDLVLRARALLRRDDRAANREARALLAQAQKAAPDYADVWIMQGEAEWQRAAYGWIEDPESGVRRAEELVRRALASPDPRSQSRAQSLVASLRTHLGHPEEALDYTARALATNPSDTSSLFRRGHALLALGRIDESIATIEGAMRFDPAAGLGPFAQLATAYYLAGRYRDTVTLVDRATGMHSRRGTMQAIRAAALAQLGEMEEARRAADAVRQFNPTHSVEEAGTRLRNPEHAAKLREGLAKAGL